MFYFYEYHGYSRMIKDNNILKESYTIPKAIQVFKSRFYDFNFNIYLLYCFLLNCNVGLWLIDIFANPNFIFVTALGSSYNLLRAENISQCSMVAGFLGLSSALHSDRNKSYQIKSRQQLSACKIVGVS